MIAVLAVHKHLQLKRQEDADEPKGQVSNN